MPPVQIGGEGRVRGQPLGKDQAVLTKEDNDLITHVGPGTPMGEVWRRYWFIAGLSREIPEPEEPVLPTLAAAEGGLAPAAATGLDGATAGAGAAAAQESD